MRPPTPADARRHERVMWLLIVALVIGIPVICAGVNEAVQFLSTP
jgi:hypothetical protein